MVASLTCTPQLTLPYTMSLWVPNLPYYDSRPHGPRGWRNRSRKEWGWLQREQAEWSGATWIYPIPRMRIFWSELQMATYAESEMVGNEAGGRSGA